MQTDLVQQALAMAIGRRRPPPGLLHHSDRGPQYTSGAYQAVYHATGITIRSHPGNCWDNAVMERFWGNLKSECVPHKTYRSLSEDCNAVIDYMECFYNAQRAHSYLGYLTPLPFEQKIAPYLCLLLLDQNT